MEELAVAAEIHGRVLVEATVSGQEPAGWLIALHGYGQSADDVLGEVKKIPGSNGWNIAAVQALHRFYTRRDERVVASWMTRQDREQAIGDNIAYIDRVINALVTPTEVHVFLGFFQGAAMAYRAAMSGRRASCGIIALGGDVPPELKTLVRPAHDETAPPRPWPPVLIGAGRDDPWYTAVRCDEDERALRAARVAVHVVRFAGGHEWTAEFRAEAGAWLARVSGR